MIGKVLEVFIPNGDLTMIGFKIQFDDDIMEFVLEQNVYTASVYKNDLVNISYDKKNNMIIEKVLIDGE